MRVELNLASRPSENHRRYLMVAGTGVAVLLLLAVLQGATYLRNWSGGRDVGRRAAELQAQVARLDTEQKQLEQALRQPQAAEVLDLSYFLNTLILQKSFSWTRTFMDMEKLIPNDVQVISIRPEVLEANKIALEMVVTGKSTEELLELVRRIETSDKFGTPVVRQETPPEGTSDVSARLSLAVTYVQK